MSLPVTDFIIQRLLEWDPTYDIGSGVATTGLLVEPLSVVLQPIVDELTVVQATQSVLTILEAADPDSFPEDIVDAIASNVFIDRDPGDLGSSVERLRFFEPQQFSAPKGALVWLGPSGQRYNNSGPISVTKAEMSLNQDGTLFYVDIPIVSLDHGSSFNTDAGTITQMEAEPVGVANSTNLFSVADGRNRETNTQLINRIKVAVTVRALVTGRGIIVTLTQNFTTIVEITPVGFGDPEMMRDIVYNVHIGGKVDVWVKTATLSTSSKDFAGIKIDTTRRNAGISTVSLPTQSVAVDLNNASLDRTAVEPSVTTVDLAVTYAETVDYALNDVAGTIARVPGSRIFHIVAPGTPGVIDSTGKQLAYPASTFFQNVRAGMILAVSAPSSVAGVYTVKRQIDAATIEIIGQFPAVSVTNVAFQVDDNLTVKYAYNPVAIDVIAAARSSARAPFTLSDVPLIQITSIQELDPLTQLPNGTVLNGAGGYGVGGFGEGEYGVGTQPDYEITVPDSNLRFSAKEDMFIEFPDAEAGLSVRVNYQYDGNIAALQAFCDDDDNRTEAASLLVRHFIPILVDTIEAISYSIPTSTQATAITVAGMAALIVAYINALTQGQQLEASDVIDLMYNNGANEVDLDPFLKLQGTVLNQDGTTAFLSPSSNGILAIPNGPVPDPTTQALTQKIGRFLANNINVTRSLA